MTTHPWPTTVSASAPIHCTDILLGIHILTLHLLTHQCTAPTRNIVKVVHEDCLVKASSMAIRYPSGTIARGSVMSEKTSMYTTPA